MTSQQLKVAATNPDDLVKDVGGSFFASDDDTEIYYKLWKPQVEPLAVIIAFHGLGDHINRYDPFFKKFAEHGILVKGMDYRGHGRTYWKNVFQDKVKPLKGYTQSFERVYKDMMLLYDLPVDQVPNLKKLPTFVFGHSLGGLFSLCFTYKCGHLIENYKGTIAQAPAFKPAKAPPAVLKWIAVNLGGWIPKHLENNQLDLSGISNDTSIIKMYQQDPYVHDKLSMQLAKDILLHADMLQKNADKFTFPVIIYHSPQDKLTDFAATKEFYTNISSQDKFFKAMNGCAHELHNEPGETKLDLLKDYVDWIRERL